MKAHPPQMPLPGADIALDVTPSNGQRNKLHPTLNMVSKEKVGQID